MKRRSIGGGTSQTEEVNTWFHEWGAGAAGSDLASEGAQRPEEQEVQGRGIYPARASFRLSTWGLVKLAWLSPNEACTAVARATDFRDPPRGFSESDAAAAVVSVGFPRPDVIVDCRTFHDPERDEDTMRHIGTYGRILERVVGHRSFSEFLRAVKNRVDQAEARHTGIVHISCVCRAGEKRSVAIADIIRHCLEQAGNTVVAVDAVLWKRRTCAGCAECTELTPSRHAALAAAYQEWQSF